MKNLIKQITPPILLSLLKKNRDIPSQDRPFYCPVCEEKVGGFVRLPYFYDDEMDKYGFVFSPFQFETLNRRAYSCPNCSTSDRNRLYTIYLKKKFEELAKTGNTYKLLDIAPDVGLSTRVLKQSFINYRSADMYMENVDDKADITKLDLYEDERFDIIICSHVLEHVDNDRKAISELYRVMKRGGFGIIMVPIMLTLEDDLENPDYNTLELRWRYYGQDDHVRMYSKKGFLRKLEEGGFKVNQLGVDYFGKDVLELQGINPRSVLYVVEK